MAVVAPPSRRRGCRWLLWRMIGILAVIVIVVLLMRVWYITNPRGSYTYVFATLPALWQEAEAKQAATWAAMPAVATATPWIVENGAQCPTETNSMVEIPGQGIECKFSTPEPIRLPGDGVLPPPFGDGGQ
jgi:hypothetical protein